jgi:hypothetical protein
MSMYHVTEIASYQQENQSNHSSHHLNSSLLMVNYNNKVEYLTSKLNYIVYSSLVLFKFDH